MNISVLLQTIVLFSVLKKLGKIGVLVLRIKVKLKLSESFWQILRIVAAHLQAATNGRRKQEEHV